MVRTSSKTQAYIVRNQQRSYPDHADTHGNHSMMILSGCKASLMLPHGLLHTTSLQRNGLCYCNAVYQREVLKEAESQCCRRQSIMVQQSALHDLRCAASHAHLALPGICPDFCVCSIGKVCFPASDQGIGWMQKFIQRFPTLYITAQHRIHMLFRGTAFLIFSIDSTGRKSTGLSINQRQAHCVQSFCQQQLVALCRAHLSTYMPPMRSTTIYLYDNI